MSKIQWIIALVLSLSSPLCAREWVLFTENASGELQANPEYVEVVQNMKPRDVVVIKRRTGAETRWIIGEGGRLGGEKFSVIYDIGHGKALRLDKDPRLNAIPSFVESAKLMKQFGVPVVEVFHETKLGGVSVALSVSMEQKEMTLLEVAKALGTNFGGGNRPNAAVEAQNMQLAGKLSTIGMDNVKKAFLEFVRRAAPFAVLDDVHPDNIVLVRRRDGQYEFKVWDTGTHEHPSTTRLITPEERSSNISFLNETRMRQTVDNAFSHWRDEISQIIHEVRSSPTFPCDAAWSPG